MSLAPSCWNMRIGFLGELRTSSGYLLPPRMLVKLPTVVKHFRKTSGRSQQTVNAQMPPELEPAMQRRVELKDGAIEANG